MANKRSFKTTNWPGILDSSHALRKFFDSRPQPPNVILKTEVQDKQPIYTPPTFLAVERDHQSWMNGAWQLATLPSDISEVAKNIKGLKDRQRKKLERKIWARPAKIDISKRAAGLAARNQEKPIGQRQTEMSPKPTNRQKPRWIKVKTPKPLPQKRPVQAFHHHRLSQHKNILIVDAKKLQNPVHLAGGVEQPQNSFTSGRNRGPRLKMSSRSKKTFNVPLCSRPTEIMDLRLPYSQQMRARQEKLFQQPEYHDQYMRMLYQQQRHQEMCQQEQLQQNYERQMSKMSQRPYSILTDAMYDDQQQSAVYSVPSKTPLKHLRAGKRLCGNFYYK
ncbi:uncharacterized protein LOC108104460 [Drosophila eugracilis]|uniref:uncharacterized protein LOC108104460 n=1 Tax=Drosophila eugracilis TaxID=29029 RepID=UPI0007E767E0|nr:uncharacterized protein LOC108104460 [Drosophila eugracilis]